MRKLAIVGFLGVVLIGLQVARSQQQPAAGSGLDASKVAASTYEHLATAIIEIETTEDELMKSILIGYHSAAQGHLKAAARDAQGRVGHLEAAAAEITNIANEGDKPIQAVRQRLAKAGHTHNTDAETKSDYMFVTNREKKGLVDLAAKVARAGANATAGEIEALGADLAKLFGSAIAPE